MNPLLAEMAAQGQVANLSNGVENVEQCSMSTQWSSFTPTGLPYGGHFTLDVSSLAKPELSLIHSFPAGHHAHWI
jgi:hypothetical protein